MTWDEAQKRRAQRQRESTSEPERPRAIFSRMPIPRRGTPGSMQIVEGDAWTLPGPPNQPDVQRTDEEDEALQERRVVPYRKSGSTATPEGTISSPKAGSAAPVPVCPKCKDKGWLRQELPPGHPNFGKLIECVCLLERRRKRRQMELLALSNLSEEQRELTLQTFSPHVRGVQQAFRKAKHLALSLQNWGSQRVTMGKSALEVTPGIVLIGGVGVGKTHLALAIANMALDAEIVVLFATVPDLLDHLRATFDPNAKGPVYDELFERMRDAELLVLDDLGTQRSNPWADEKIFQLMNHRYNRRLPTVITMNEKSWTYLDDRLQSRLSDQSFVEIVGFKGAQDYRRRQERNAVSGEHGSAEGDHV